MVNKAAKPVFIASGVLAVVALAFGLCMLFGKHLPEGVLVVGLGFCIFGTAGLLTTLGGDDTSPSAKADKPKKAKKNKTVEEDDTPDEYTEALKHLVEEKRANPTPIPVVKKPVKAVPAEKSYEVLVNPVGYNPVKGMLVLTDTCMKITSGDETLTPTYAEISEVRLETPVLYIDWEDDTTWEMRFTNPMATSVIYNKLKNFTE